MCTATNSAKVKALKANPQIALTIDTTDHPPQILLIRGAASLETVDGIPDEYLQNAIRTCASRSVGRLAGRGSRTVQASGAHHRHPDVGEGDRLREDTAERGSGTRGETTEVTLLLVAFVPGGSWGVPGIDPDEVQRMFATAWTLLS